jgi:hypothetical protein
LTTLTPLSLLVACRLSFPIVGLRMSSLPTLAMKSPIIFSYGTSGIYQKPFLVLHRTCSLYHQFYLQLGHGHSEPLRLGSHKRTKCVRFRNIKKLIDLNLRVHVCLVCWDLLVSFYFYNGRHKVRYNGRILCARVAPALVSYMTSYHSRTPPF